MQLCLHYFILIFYVKQLERGSLLLYSAWMIDQPDTNAIAKRH